MPLHYNCHILLNEKVIKEMDYFEKTQIEKIIWDRYDSLKDQQKLINLKNNENIFGLDIDSEKCIWNLYLFDVKNVNESTRKEVEIEFGDDLYCWLIAEKVYINHKEIGK